MNAHAKFTPADADPVDIHVGARVRLLRKSLKISQEKLAEHLGLTFQQVQKYERGFNRVSASKLYAIAQLFHVGPGYFFEGLAFGADDPLDDADLTAALLNPKIRAVAIACRQMSDDGIEAISRVATAMLNGGA